MLMKIVRNRGSGPINGLINGSKNAYKKYSLTIKNKEFALIKWYPRVKTDIHNHNGKKCSFLLLNGPLIETVYENKFEGYHIPSTMKKRERWNIGYIDDKIGFHCIKNPCNKSKYSIHYYR